MQSISTLIHILTFCQAAHAIDLEAWAEKSEKLKINDISKQISQTVFQGDEEVPKALRSPTFIQIYYPYNLKMGDKFDLERLKKYLGRKTSVSFLVFKTLLERKVTCCIKNHRKRDNSCVYPLPISWILDKTRVKQFDKHSLHQASFNKENPLQIWTQLYRQSYVQDNLHQMRASVARQSHASICR